LERSAKYKKEIIKELFFKRVLSAGDIATVIQKSQPMIGKILNDLIKEGWIVESGYASSTGGRRPQMFSLAQSKFYVVAVAVDQHIPRPQ